MPNTKASKKALRVSLRKRLVNLEKIKKIKLSRRAFHKALKAEKPNKKETEKEMSKYFSALDKATKTNFIHKNKASRLKSRASLWLTKVFDKGIKFE